MCQPIQSDNVQHGSLTSLNQPRDTEVKVTDVKSIKVDLVYPCDLVRNDSKVRGSVESIPKEFSTFKPESPGNHFRVDHHMIRNFPPVRARTETKLWAYSDAK